MSLFRRIVEFISYPSHSRTMGLLALLIVLLAIPLTVNIAQKQQEIRQHAAGTQCEDNGGYCTNGVCAKYISKCLYDATKPDNCASQGAACTPDVGDTTQPAHTYQCSEIQSFSCTTTSKPPCPGECTGVQTCQQVNGGTVDTNYSCSTGACCIATTSKPACPGTCTGVQTCQNADANGFGVAGNIDTNYRCDSPGSACCIIPGGGTGSGSPNPGICIKTCQNGQVVASGPSAACAQLPNPDCAISPTSSSAPSGGPTGIPCNVNNQNDNWSYSCGTNAGCQPGYHKASCKTNPSQNTDTCWPDSAFTDSNPCASSAPASPAGGTSCTEANCKIGDGKICLRDVCTERPNQVECSVTPTCGSGNTPFKLSSGKYICTNDQGPTTLLPTVGPTCSVAQACTDVSGGKPACQAAANSCNVTKGTRSYIKNIISGTTSTNCSTVTVTNEACDLTSTTTTCTTPNTCNSSNQCVAQTQGPLTGNTQLTFSIGLDAIGSTGDQKSQGNSSGSNKNPRTSSKSFSIEILDSNNNVVKTVGSGLLTSTTTPRLNYNSSSGKYEGSVLVDLTAGTTYSVKIQGDRYLKRKLGSITGGQPNVLSGNLVAGVMAGNNFLSAADYGNLLGCLFKPLQATITFCNLADLDDNGVVDQFDYNLFLREISVVQNGD